MLIGSIYYYSVSGFQKSQPLGIMHRAVARALDLVTQSPSHDRIANTTALIEGARRLGIRYGHRAPQNAFFQTWRAAGQAGGPVAVRECSGLQPGDVSRS